MATSINLNQDVTGIAYDLDQAVRAGEAEVHGGKPSEADIESGRVIAVVARRTRRRRPNCPELDARMYRQRIFDQVAEDVSDEECPKCRKRRIIAQNNQGFSLCVFFLVLLTLAVLAFVHALVNNESRPSKPWDANARKLINRP